MLYFGQEVGEPAREHAGFGALLVLLFSII